MFYFFPGFLFDGIQRATVVGRAAKNSRAFVFIIIYTIAVCVGNGATMVFGNTSHIFARILLVVHPIAVCIRNRAAVVFGRTGHGSARILFIINAIVIGIG